MRFVHLAPRSVVGMIKKRGLHLGDGRWGRGVYAVPLLRVPRFRPKDSTNDLWTWDETDLSTPVTSGDLWKWLFSEGRPRGLRPIAVIFETPSECWPADLYLDMPNDVGAKLIPYLQRTRIEGVEVSSECLRWSARAIEEEGAWTWLEARIFSERALGTLLNRFLTCGGRLGSAWNEGLQFVIRRPVPKKAIVRLVALSQTNVEARRRRHRALSDE